MIDTATENLVALRDVPRCLPPRPTGKRLHISAVYRWTLRGVRGVRLETVKIGGTTYTSREAIQRFSERLSGAEPAPQLINPVSRKRQRQIEQANAAVAKALGIDRLPHNAAAR
ncbi:MAG: DUF1580 domain-containing protein [Phycisphaerae bacterium]|nr:DUF1580 domain-containing protein [Phycisphaerae bacterium]NUQ44840.1 DUF1580 domain-containing protein [Phycisphaerae bacterium]